MRCIVVPGILVPNEPELSASGGHDTFSRASLWAVANTLKNLYGFLDDARLVEGAPGKKLVLHSKFSNPSTRSSQSQCLDTFNEYVTTKMVKARAELLAKKGFVEGLNAKVDVWVEKFRLEGITGLAQTATPENKFDRFIAAWKELYGLFKEMEKLLRSPKHKLASSWLLTDPPASSTVAKHLASVTQTPWAPPETLGASTTAPGPLVGPTAQRLAPHGSTAPPTAATRRPSQRKHFGRAPRRRDGDETGSVDGVEANGVAGPTGSKRMCTEPSQSFSQTSTPMLTPLEKLERLVESNLTLGPLQPRRLGDEYWAAPPLPKRREPPRTEKEIEEVKAKLGNVTEPEKIECRKAPCPLREITDDQAGDDVLIFDRATPEVWAYWYWDERRNSLAWSFREYLARKFSAWSLAKADWKAKLAEGRDVTDGGEQARGNLLRGYDEAAINKAVKELQAVKNVDDLHTLCKKDPLANDLQIAIRMNPEFFVGVKRYLSFSDWTLPSQYCVWNAEGVTRSIPSGRGYIIARRRRHVGKLLQGLRECSATACKHIDGKTWYNEFLCQLIPTMELFVQDYARDSAGVQTSRKRTRKGKHRDASVHLFQYL